MLNPTMLLQCWHPLPWKELPCPACLLLSATLATAGSVPHLSEHHEKPAGFPLSQDLPWIVILGPATVPEKKAWANQHHAFLVPTPASAYLLTVAVLVAMVCMVVRLWKWRLSIQCWMWQCLELALQIASSPARQCYMLCSMDTYPHCSIVQTVPTMLPWWNQVMSQLTWKSRFTQSM